MMRRGVAWVIMGLVVMVILISAYAFVSVLQQPDGGGTPTPTKTPLFAAAATSTPAVTSLSSPSATIPTATLPPPTSTPTPLPTATPTPMPPTPTPSETPYVVPGGSYGVNVRLEPGTGDVPVIGVLRVDEGLAIVGKNPDGSWWQVCCVADQVGWVYTGVVKAIGPLDGVPLAPEYAPSPSPTPAVPSATETSLAPSPVATTPTPVPPTTVPTATAVVTPTVSAAGQIRGVVYWDRNGNGVLDGGEPVLAEALISIYRLPEMTPAGNVITGGDGVFLFEDLEPGGYTLFETAPSGFAVEPAESVVTVNVEAGQVAEVSFRNSPLE